MNKIFPIFVVLFFSGSISFAASTQINNVIDNQDGTISVKNPRVSIEGRLHKVGFLSFWGLCKLKGYGNYAGGTHEWITSASPTRERLVSIDDDGQNLSVHFSDNNSTDAFVTSVKCEAP